MLARGGSALEAVVEAVVVLEDDPHFNAGLGSVLTVEGTLEMDASVMAGGRRPRRAGGGGCGGGKPGPRPGAAPAPGPPGLLFGGGGGRAARRHSPPPS